MRFLPCIIFAGIALCLLCSASSEVQAQDQTGHNHAAAAQDRPKADGLAPSILIQETHIELGTISGDTTKISGSIVVENVGDDTLRIMDLDGPCNCFTGYHGDEIVEPGGMGVIQALFDKSKLPAGEVRRMVRVLSNDPLKKAVEVHFNFLVERDPMEEELRKLNTEVARLHKEMRAVRSGVQKIIKNLDINKTSTRKPPDTRVYNVTIGDSPMLGKADAPITIVEFADFDCPYCLKEISKLKQILKEFPDDVRLVFKHYPLKKHVKAKPAHVAAELAKREGGHEAFWKMHDTIVANIKHIEIADLRKYVQEQGLDLAKFNEAISSSDNMDNLLQQDMQEARKCNVTGTPTILVNGLKMVKRDMGSYRVRIDQILRQQMAAKNKTRN
jgi:protein-disulfide isomerase